MSVKRLEARVLKEGLHNLEDVEVIELLLKLQLDALDHRYEAQELLDYYGSLSEVIDASADIPFDGSPYKEDYRLALRLPHEIANRYLYDRLRQRPLLNCSDAVVDYLNHSMRGLRTEHFKVLYLNGMNRLITNEDISKGTVNQAIVYPREVVKSALMYNAAGLIFAHNHVSGNLRPSADDVRITERLYNAAKLFDIVVQDHIIIGGDGHFSFADAGLLKKSDTNKAVIKSV